MGTLDSLKAAYGDDILTRGPATGPAQHWAELCVCGHLDRYHSPSVGGAYRLAEPTTKVLRDVEWTNTNAFLGCVGSLKPTGFEEFTTDADPAAHTTVQRINPTCPCVNFQPVAKVDRPNRYFNQRVPRDRQEAARHPMVVGVRAFNTHLSRRKAAQTDPDWATAEFDRRFIRSDAWVCGISKCTETDAWPIYVDGERSELRCAAHR